MVTGIGVVPTMPIELPKKLFGPGSGTIATL
jgi:hypothetical protein